MGNIIKNCGSDTVRTFLPDFCAKARDERGMTLIDVSIALMVVALIAYPLIKQYDNFVMKGKLDAINDSLSELDLAVQQFYFANKRYPCPANLTLPRDDANYGMEMKQVTPNSPNPDIVVCTNAGGTALSGETDIAKGMLPFKSLKLGEDQVYDPWHNRIVYAVSAVMASSAFSDDDYYDAAKATSKAHISVDGFYLADPYDNFMTYAPGDRVNNGGYGFQCIAATTGNAPPNTTYWTPLLSPRILGTNSQVQYVLVSHGADGAGAYTRDGVLADACPSATVREAENCDADNDFFINNPDASIYNTVAGIELFDDFTYFRDTQAAGMKPIGNSSDMPDKNMMWSPEDAKTGEVENKSFMVGIGVNPPDDPLDVDGNILIDDGDAKTYQVCSEDGADCFPVETIAGSTTVDGEEVGYIWCESGLGFASGIAHKDANCSPASIDYFGGTTRAACPSGQLMTGVSGGSIQCVASPY